jgi:GABA permease
MRNPLRSEAEAFRFVLLTIGYFALIVVAAAIDRWLGLAVFALLTAIAAIAVWRMRADAPPRRAVGRSGEGDARRVLVIANETVGGSALHDLLRELSSKSSLDVLVVCPALNSRLRHWASDEDEARTQAQARLDESLAALAASGVRARGEVGDADPLQAIDDALRTFGADELIISTHPPGRSHWLERGIVNEARRRYDMPIAHVVAQ